jgi:hypothetical protein
MNPYGEGRRVCLTGSVGGVEAAARAREVMTALA